MLEALYEWPAPARVTLRVPKEKIYQKAKVSPAIKTLFVEQVLRIEWSYKLAPKSTNLQGSQDIPEFQVFTVVLKDDELDLKVLAAIDAAVAQPVLFEVVRSSGDARQTQLQATFKAYGAGTSKPRSYFYSEWIVADTPRRQLPVAVSLDALYTQILSQLSEISIDPGETLQESAARLAKIDAINADIASLNRRIKSETQFKKKFALRGQLDAKKSELKSLTERV
ncbi:DUF4391 domain-containing protein [Corynebacterium pseudodiphtheriticum]|uniref:DUF4391 domain-containing protein n=1 Tax=Corynebacterium pseudodiphtheriticum TaxID=37637 RepID=UPI00254144FB|nr:DUF4391 domain-containing protein [Corynebacterium pseudodiphtheriticum]MDK4321890.1 DUF4391 domain-containing protein [Corynebacterium pseudodiphtheriticum]